MDMDIDDLLLVGRQNQATSRTGRFQPNAGKLKPKPKPKPEPAPVVDTPSPSLPVKKQEDSSLNTTEPLHSTANITETVEEKCVAEGGMAVDEPDCGVDDGEEEDRVVREIDVFYNPSPVDGNAQLYIMQYPLRPCWRPYELNERCQEVRVNPEHSKLEVDLEINVDNENYDEAAADPLRFQKQTLSSSKAPLVTGYAVGFLLGNKLHLNPVHAVVQLRPSMGYLNTGQVQKDNVTGSEVMTSSDKPWISLEYHCTDSPFSSKYRQNMAAKESSHIQFAMSSFDYVNSLCPGTSSDNNRAKGPSRRFLLTLPLEERIKKWFSEGPQVHRFAALMHLAPADSEEDVLKVLQQHADLVQGLWVAKSSLRCEGVQALTRDYILLLFSASKSIRIDQLTVLKVPNEILTHALTPLAVKRSAFEDWKFKEPEDRSFIKAHPDIVENQRRAWSNREKHIMDAVHGLGRRNAPAMARNSSRIGDQGTKGRASTSVSADQSAKGGLDRVQRSGTTTMSAETREALPKALLELFRSHSVCNLQLICEGLREMAVSKSSLPKADASARAARAAALGVSFLPEMQSILSQVAINIHGVYVLKSLDNPDIDPLRTVVVNLFCGKEPNAKLKKADIVAAAKIELNRDISNSEYIKVVSELCISKGGAWMLKSGDPR